MENSVDTNGAAGDEVDTKEVDSENGDGKEETGEKEVGVVEKKTKIEETCETVLEWVTNNEGADAASFKKKQEEVVLLWNDHFKERDTEPKTKGISYPCTSYINVHLFFQGKIAQRGRGGQLRKHPKR